MSEDDTAGEGRRPAGWSEKMVSWGHMMISLAVLAGAFMAYTVTNERSAERRLTQLEERYIQLAERNREQDAQVASLLQSRNIQIGSIERKLDSIANDIVQLKTDVVALKVQTATMQQQLQRRF